MSLLTKSYPYEPPLWAQSAFSNHPMNGRLHLANLPTPLYQLLYPSSHSNTFISQLESLNITLFIKRDDSTGGVELGGNKIRKLEFLLADALARNCDSVLTIGGEQSNHCRATAAASRIVGLEPHLILRTMKKKNDVLDTNEEQDIGFVGNLLMDRMVGSYIYTCTAGEYGRLGSEQLLERVSAHLEEQGRRPYKIPVGGSNGLGSWGYIQAVDELLQQWNDIESKPSLDHIVFACGSGGTACGIALGIALAYNSLQTCTPQVHAVGVCDDPDYFYTFVAKIADEMGFIAPENVETEEFVRKHMPVHQGKGSGYALATQDELEFTASFAQSSGIVLDPVYSGKALYNFMLEVEGNPEVYRNKNVLFWHTGGALGLFDKLDVLAASLRQASPCVKLDIYGKGHGLDLSKDLS
jgi:D-cysteine desulfhydrase